MHLRPLGQLSTSIFQSVFPTNKNSFKKLLGRKTGKKTKNYSILMFWNPDESRVLCGRNRLSYGEFRVSPVMTTSIRLHICQSAVFLLQKRWKSFWKELTERTAPIQFSNRAQSPINQGFSQYKTNTFGVNFESVPLWPLRYVSEYDIHYICKTVGCQP